MTDLSESHGASQVEIRLLGTQITPASSVAKISWWHRKAGARRAQCQAKKTGKIEEKVANAAKRTGKVSKKQFYP